MPEIAIGIAIGIGIEKKWFQGMKNSGVYRLAIGYEAWVFEKSGQLNGIHRHVRDQQTGGGILRLHAARRWNAPPLEDVPVVVKALDKTQSRKRNSEPDRMAVML